MQETSERAVCLNIQTMEAINDYRKIRRLDFGNAVNDLIMKGYKTACEEIKRCSLMKAESERLARKNELSEREIITHEEIEAVWRKADFGNTKKRDVIRYGLLKCVCNFQQGSQATRILKELGLISDSCEVLPKGRKYLWYSFKK